MPDRAPVRVAHLGLGAFHRAHQAWYTEQANSAGGRWGIEAFTGRHPDAAIALAAQDCRYSLIERSADGDAVQTIASIVRATDGADQARWREVIADPAVGVLTLTVTEAGYRLAADGGPDWSDAALAGDLAALADDAPVTTAPGRIVDGLRARRRAGGEPFAVVSCDNLPSNGAVTRAVVAAVAERVDESLAAWIDAQVVFVSSMVDRITPATAPEDLEVPRRAGIDDAVPVVTEPFTEWVLCGAFPVGRPGWEAGGARFVERLEPFEQRKLWLLNGAHSLLAYAGLALGFATVDEAMGDPWSRDRVEELWVEARDVLDLPSGELDDATTALRERFANPRIRHRLEQVARDGAQKLGPRIVDVQRRRLAAGLPVGASGALAIAAWLLHLERLGEPAPLRAALDRIAPDVAGDLEGPVRVQLARLTDELDCRSR